MMVMKNVRKAVLEILNKTKGTVLAIETGTIRSHHEKHESTRHIAEVLGDRGFLTSVDSSVKAISISKSICAHCKNIIWVQSDSVEFLRKVKGPFDFVLLDSANKAEVIWSEFCAVVPKIRVGGILIVDDAGIRLDGGIDKSIQAKKGHLVWSNLSGVPVKVLNSAHGTQLRIDFTKETLKLILERIK